MRRITTEEAQEFIPLKENFLDQSVKNAEYFTITPSKQGDGWEDVTYFTARRKNKFSNRGEGDQWVYVLSNPTQPGIWRYHTKLHGLSVVLTVNN